ncbi:MAG: RNA polymerase sigma-70 factor, partial [Bacteroidota bacterium]
LLPSNFSLHLPPESSGMANTLSAQEQEWLAGLNRGEDAAFRQIFDQYYKYLVVTAYNYVNDDAKAKDLTQDVFVELWKKRADIVITSSLKSYLRRSVINKALNWIKSQKRFDFGDESLDQNWTSTETDAIRQLEGADLQAIIQTAIDGLPERCRTVFKLSRFENLSHKEIAAQLNISTKTIENQMTKALKIIRAAVEQHGLVWWLLLWVL